MDPELRAYLEAMTTRMDSIAQRAIARDAATREALETQGAAIRKESAETRHALEAKIDEARREACAMFESLVHEIRTLPEGFSTYQRQEAGRLDAEREEAMLNRHVLPLEASAADHEKRIKAVEKRR